MHEHIYTKGVWDSGGMLLKECLDFRFSETASGAFSVTVSLVFIKRWEKLFSTAVVETGIDKLIVAISKGIERLIVAISKGKGQDLIKGGRVPPCPPKLTQVRGVHYQWSHCTIFINCVTSNLGSPERERLKLLINAIIISKVHNTTHYTTSASKPL